MPCTKSPVRLSPREKTLSSSSDLEGASLPSVFFPDLIVSRIWVASATARQNSPAPVIDGPEGAFPLSVSATYAQPPSSDWLLVNRCTTLAIVLSIFTPERDATHRPRTANWVQLLSPYPSLGFGPAPS